MRNFVNERYDIALAPRQEVVEKSCRHLVSLYFEFYWCGSFLSCDFEFSGSCNCSLRVCKVSTTMLYDPPDSTSDIDEK